MINRLDFVTLKDATGPVMAVLGGTRDPKTKQYTQVSLTRFDGSERRIRALPVEQLLATTDRPSAELVLVLNQAIGERAARVRDGG